MIVAAFILLQTVSPTQVANVERSAPLVREQLDAQLVDYPSARFRDVFVTANTIAEAESGKPGQGYLCGFVNSKNRMGGYVGWKRFMAFEDTVQIEGDSISDIVINSACGPRSVNDGIDRSAWVQPR